LFDGADKNTDKKLDFDEFKELKKEAAKQAELQAKRDADPEFALFYAADTNKDDQVSLDEWKVEAKKADPNADDVELEKGFNTADTEDPKGQLNLNEFKVLVANEKKLPKDPE